MTKIERLKWLNDQKDHADMAVHLAGLLKDLCEEMHVRGAKTGITSKYVPTLIAMTDRLKRLSSGLVKSIETDLKWEGTK